MKAKKIDTKHKLNYYIVVVVDIESIFRVLQGIM